MKYKISKLQWIFALAIVLAGGGARAADAPPVPPARHSARALMEEGRRRYGAGDYAGALAFFEEAGRRAGRGLDPARAQFNAAAALQRGGRLEEAEARLRAALKTSDLETQARAWYNLGHASMTRAEGLADGGDPSAARTPMDEAVEAYRNAIRLAPDDLEAKINYEWAARRREELEEAARQQEQEQQQEQPQDPADGDDGEQKPDDPSGDGEEPEPPPGEGEPPPGGEPGEPPEGEPEGEPSGEPTETGTPEREREMTPEDAARLLDAMREEEDAQRRNLRLRLGQPVPVEKDW